MISHLVPEALRRPDLAIDLGTAITRVAGNRSAVYERPSITDSRHALARGAIIDVEAAAELLRRMLRDVRAWGLSKVRALACAPITLTSEERFSVIDCVMKAGAAGVVVVPQPLAAAVGAGVDVGSSHAKLVVDLGEGITECAVIREGQVVQFLSARCGCSDWREKIRNRMQHRFHCSITSSEAERVLRFIGVRSASAGQISVTTFKNGRLKNLRVPESELRAGVESDFCIVLETVQRLLADLPPSFSVEIIEDGLFLTGGGSLLPGVRERLAAVTKLDVHVAQDPLGAVVHGARAMLPIAAALKLWRH